MLFQFLFCLLMNHLNASLGISMSSIQMNAAMLATGVFAFVALRLHIDAREKERRVAAALLIW
jgi:hypothetical protein